MKRRKLNISSWHSLGLAALLVIACLMMSTGTSLARYRSDMSETINFKSRVPVSVFLGRVEYAEDATKGEFVHTEAVWEQNEDGQLQLDFAVANGSSRTAYEEQNQQVYIQLIGSLGLQSDDQEISLILTVPAESDTEEPEQIEATAVRIKTGSALHATFGDGWVFRFEDKDGAELSWMLEGGKLSYLEMGLTLEGSAATNPSLLQLQIASEYVKD